MKNWDKLNKELDEALNNLSDEEIIAWIKHRKAKKDFTYLPETPPDELLEVMDTDGNTAFAQPTWYPFRVVPNPKKVGKWTSDVVDCDPYWDGGWMTKCNGIEPPILGDIIAWRKIQNKI